MIDFWPENNMFLDIYKLKNNDVFAKRWKPLRQDL